MSDSDSDSAEHRSQRLQELEYLRAEAARRGDADALRSLDELVKAEGLHTAGAAARQLGVATIQVVRGLVYGRIRYVMFDGRAHVPGDEMARLAALDHDVLVATIDPHTDVPDTVVRPAAAPGPALDALWEVLDGTVNAEMRRNGQDGFGQLLAQEVMYGLERRGWLLVRAVDPDSAHGPDEP